MLQRDRINKLQQTMAEGGKKAFDLVPTYLANIIKDREWEKRYNRKGKSFTSFEAFISADLWEGLETSVDELLVYCRKRKDVQKLINTEIKAIEKTAHDERGLFTRIDIVKTVGGNNPTYALKRLKRDRPDLADKVIAGELSANAAAIKAGFRKKQVKRCPKCGHEW